MQFRKLCVAIKLKNSPPSTIKITPCIEGLELAIGIESIECISLAVGFEKLHFYSEKHVLIIIAFFGVGLFFDNQGFKFRIRT